MKNLVAISMILLFSCSPTITKIEAVKSFYGVDFRPFTERGFLITPKDYTGEYESIGVLEYKSMPEANYAKVPVSGSTEGVDGKWIRQDVVIEQVMDEYYNAAVEMGANAVMNFQIRAVEESYNTGIYGIVTIPGIEITGFAIKRK